MKATYVILFLALITLSTSCKKSSNDSPSSNDYFMKFTINGETKEYNGSTLAEFSSPNYEANMIALKDSLDGSANTMSIVLYSTNAFNTNVTYTEEDNADSYPGASLIYSDASGNITSSLNTTLAPDTKVSVMFTAITDQYVKGTFSGKLYENASETAIYTVTDGSFYLKKE